LEAPSNAVNGDLSSARLDHSSGQRLTSLATRVAFLDRHICRDRFRAPGKGGPGVNPLGNAGCFVAGTWVATPDGLRPIEEIEAGDDVLVVGDTGETEAWVVTATRERIYVGAIVWIEVLGDDGSVETIGATADHPFLLKRGVERDPVVSPEGIPPLEPMETPSGRWIAAGSLLPGDLLAGTSGDIEVVSVISDREVTLVYNLEVKGLARYHVGLAGCVVHNNAGCMAPTPQAGRMPERGQARSASAGAWEVRSGQAQSQGTGSKLLCVSRRLQATRTHVQRLPC
jgi:hypothetical protein